MCREPQVVTRASARVLRLMLYVAALAVATPDAQASGEPPATPAVPRGALTGQSACNLVPLIAPSAHPLRRHPALKGAVDALALAGDDKKKNAAAHQRFERALAPLWKEAARAFARPELDPRTGEPRPFAPASAKAFLTKWVFSPTPVLRVGEERFEPALEVSAWMVQAACRAGEVDEAMALARAASGVEGAPLRAFAALLLLERGAADEARHLVLADGVLGPSGSSARNEVAAGGVAQASGFLGAWVRAELAEDRGERARLNELAGRLVASPDQEVAWKSQRARL